jgi:hypothetical protein
MFSVKGIQAVLPLPTGAKLQTRWGGELPETTENCKSKVAGQARRQVLNRADG